MKAMETLDFMGNLNPTFALLKRLRFEDACKLIEQGVWKDKISDITVAASPDSTSGSFRFISIAAEGPECLTVTCSDLFYTAIQKCQYSGLPNIRVPGTDSRYVMGSDPQHPLCGYSIPGIVKRMHLANFSYDTRFVFGTHSKGQLLSGDHFEIQPPTSANHVMLILSEVDVKNNKHTRALLEEWSEFHYTVPHGGYYPYEFAYILPIGFELCPTKSSLSDEEIKGWMDRFARNADAAYRTKCLRGIQRSLLDLQRVNDEIDDKFETQILTFAQQLCDSRVNLDDPAAEFHFQAYMDAALRVLNARLDGLRVSSYFHMSDEPYRIAKDNSYFTIDQALSHIDWLKSEHEAKAAEEEIEAIKQDAKTEFEPKFKEFAPRLKALSGWMKPVKEGMLVFLPRTEFAKDQKPYRVTTYGYCEAGLDKFIISLANEEESGTEAKARNDAALHAIRQGTTQSPDADDSDPAIQPAEQGLWARFTRWFSNLFKKHTLS